MGSSAGCQPTCGTPSCGICTRKICWRLPARVKILRRCFATRRYKPYDPPSHCALMLGCACWLLAAYAAFGDVVRRRQQLAKTRRRSVSTHPKMMKQIPSCEMHDRQHVVSATSSRSQSGASCEWVMTTSSGSRTHLTGRGSSSMWSSAAQVCRSKPSGRQIFWQKQCNSLADSAMSVICQ